MAQRNYKDDRIIKVDWDTDGEDVGLPEEVLIPGFVPDDDVSPRWVLLLSRSACSPRSVVSRT